MLRENIQKETITAMKAGDKDRVAALCQISAKVKDRDIEQRTATGVIEDDELVSEVLLKMAKQRRESITLYEQGGREELAAKERAELAVIEGFLPKKLDEGETRAEIAEVKAALGASGMKDMGRVMAELKTRHGAALEPALASALVKQALA